MDWQTTRMACKFDAIHFRILLTAYPHAVEMDTRKSQSIRDAVKTGTAIFDLVFRDSYVHQWKIDGVEDMTVCND